MTGEQIIYALEHCKDDCKNCVASFNGKSCKEQMVKIDEWAKKQKEKFAKLLESVK